MKYFSLVLVLFLRILAQADALVFIKSTEDIVFHTPDVFKFSDAGKISEFKGVIDRTYFVASDLKMVDLYHFSSDKVKVSKQMCVQYAEKIFTFKKTKLFKLTSLKVENTNKGQICEAVVSDKNMAKEDPYLRYVMIGFINAKANVLVFHPKNIDDEKISEMKKFWNSLR